VDRQRREIQGLILLPGEKAGSISQWLLISETVVPGFEFCDPDFLNEKGLEELVSPEQAHALQWLLSLLGKGEKSG